MPDLWVTRRPASGDATGRKLREIIEKAATKIIERDTRRKAAKQARR